MEKEAAIRPGRTIGRSLVVVLALIAAVVSVMAISATAAKADTAQIKVPDATINLGGQEGYWVKLIDPTLDPPDAPALITTDYDAATGDFSEPKENFYFAQKRIKDLYVGDPALPYVDVKIDIKAESDFTGNFDPTTGTFEASVPAFVLIDVYQQGSPVSAGKCSVSGFNLELSTTGNMSDPGAPADEGPPPTPARDPHEYDATPFAEFPGTSPGAPGVVIAEWSDLPSAQVVSGALGGIICPKLDGLLGGPGGVVLDGTATGDAEATPKAPQLAPKITASPAATTEDSTAKFDFAKGDTETEDVTGFDCKIDATEYAPCDEGTKTYDGQRPGSHTFMVRATNSVGIGPEASYTWTIEEAAVCPEGQTGTPPNCITDPGPGDEKGKLGALKVSPKVKAVKRGKKATFKAKVKNVGKGTAKRVKVCVTAPKKFISVKKCVTVGNIAAGKSKTAKFKVTVKKKAKKGKKISLKFKATSKGAGTKSGTGTVKVK